MPRDKRLYMTFPNDFHRHPKVERLPVEIRWAFVEMNGEARIADNDGIFSIEDAEFMWPREVLDALVQSHPARPLIIRTDDCYVIREYAEHQQTKEQREDLHTKRSAAGAAGAAAKYAKRQANAKQVPSKPQQSQAEIELETEIDISTSNEVESPRKRAHSIRSDFAITDQMRAWGRDQTPLVDLDAKLPEFIDYWQGVGKAMKDWESVWRNGMRKQQGFAERDTNRGAPVSKADRNAAEYQRLYGGPNERAGSTSAIQP